MAVTSKELLNNANERLMTLLNEPHIDAFATSPLSSAPLVTSLTMTWPVNASPDMDNLMMRSASDDVWETGAAGYQWPMLALFGIVLAAVSGNVLVCLAVYREPRMRSTFNCFLVSLAVSDVLSACLVMPLSIMKAFDGNLALPKMMCLAWYSLDVLFTSSTIIHLCMISVDRFMSLTYPLRYGHSRTKKHFVTRIALVWIISACIAGPLFLLSMIDLPDSVDGVYKGCGPETPVFVISATMTSFYVPLAIMSVMYVLTVRALHRQRRGHTHIALTQSISSSHRPGDGEADGPSSFASPWSSPEVVRRSLRNTPSVSIRVSSAASIAPVGTVIVMNGSVAENAAADQCNCHTGLLSTASAATLAVPLDTRGGATLPLRRNNVSLQSSSSCTSLREANSANRSSTISTSSTFQCRSPTSEPDSELATMTTSVTSSSAVTSNGTASNSGWLASNGCLRLSPQRVIANSGSSQSVNNAWGNGSTTPTSSGVGMSNGVDRPQTLRRCTSSSRAYKGRRAVQVLGILFAAFVMFYLPFFAAYLLRGTCAACRQYVTPAIITAFEWLAYSGSVVNPIIYHMFNPDFRRAFQRLLHCTKRG